MALPVIAAAAGRALPKIAQGAGKFLKKGWGIPSPGAAEDKEKTTSNIFTPGGVVMLAIGALLDFLTLICAILIIVFGVGLLLAKIVYFTGLIITSVWALSRGGALPIKKGGKEMNPLMVFLKRQWKKLVFRAVPGIGDAIPFLWTYTIFSELQKS